MAILRQSPKRVNPAVALARQRRVNDRRARTGDHYLGRFSHA
jgi:hypothetical protein